MHGCSKEKQILRAAEELFTTRRFHEVTLDHVCRKAGVGKGTIYRYFKDKEDLFHRMVLSGFSDLCALIRCGTSEDGGFVGQLTRALYETRKFFVQRRALFRVMQAEEGRVSFRKQALRSQWSEHRKDLISAVAAIIQRGVAGGHVRQDVSPELLAGTLLGMLRGYYSQQDAHEISPASMNMLVELFLKGAAPLPVTALRDP
jgi:AcrR family transcriptional regulator